MDTNQEFLECECMLDSARGIYIPQNFAECYNMEEWGISKEDEKILLDGPDNEEYWETWSEVLFEAQYTDKDADVTWCLHQGESGDLFAVQYNPDFEC